MIVHQLVSACFKLPRPYCVAEMGLDVAIYLAQQLQHASSSYRKLCSVLQAGGCRCPETYSTFCGRVASEGL